MKTRTLDITNCSDWDLVLAANWAALKSDLSPEVEQEVLAATWRKQDGYGKVGFRPPQGWDWSGIRDSTDHAKGEMAKAIRKVLGKHRITTITVTYEDAVRF